MKYTYIFVQNAARVWNASVFNSSDISNQFTCFISLFIQICSVGVHHCTVAIIAGSFTTLRLVLKVDELLLSISFNFFFCESFVNDVFKMTVNWIVRVRFVFFRPSLCYFEIPTVLVILGHFCVIPVFLSVYFVREVFVTSLSRIRLLELILRTMVSCGISEQHQVILSPIFVTLFQ